MFNPNKHKDKYEEDQGGSDFAQPVEGTFDIVNVALQRQKIGKHGTPKLRVTAHVLRVVEAENKEGAKAMVGQLMGLDLWMTLQKSYNAEKFSFMCIANGVDQEFDEEDDRSLVEAITGTPYRIRIGVTKVERGKGKKPIFDVEIQETKHLSSAARKKYAGLPDWSKVVGDKDQRMKAEKDYTPKKNDGDGDGEGGGDGEGFYDDDLPF